MRKLLIITVLLFGMNSFGQTQNNIYANIDVFNNNGQNPHDFIFSYDIINGSHTCINNFEVINNTNIVTSFRFQILINDIIVFTGQANNPVFGSVFFNNAFTNCNSLSSRIRIIVL